MIIIKKAPTSCEATSYCKLGTCITEGNCKKNTPERLCDNTLGGFWVDDEPDNIAQCTLGCCLMGEQASFVTQTRCTKISGLYGLETNFRTDINSELECIASVRSEVKGACVFDSEFQRTCKFISKSDCDDVGSSNASSVEFHAEFLCSAEELATICGPSEETTCVEGRDEVFFKDTCGNLANIYDSSRINNKNYWTKVVSRAESCGDGSANKDSSECGNCDYYLGSTCKAYDRTEDKSKPDYGDNICRDLACDNGKEHGESWCETVGDVDKPGNRDFRMVCYNNEVTVEPCADFRQEICRESAIEDFSTANCIANMWQDCVVQEEQKDCENIDKRDCVWLANDDEIELEKGDDIACVAARAPGFDFWNPDGEAEELCGQVSETCNVVFTEGLIGGEDCEENCECLTDSWKEEKSEICVAMGDCGVDVNYQGAKGYNEIDDLYTRSDDKE